MGINILVKASLSENFGQLINKDIIEPIIVSLMNQSQTVFPGKYHRVLSQSMGECDFVDISTGSKFESKLPLTKKQGALIGSRNHDYRKWMQSMNEIESEFSDCMNGTNGLVNIEKLELYQIMHQRLTTVEEDENVIFFFPYPIVLDAEDLATLAFCGDLLSYVFTELCKCGCVGSRDVYAIYPSIDSKVVLRRMKTDMREYISYTELDHFVKYTHYLNQDE